MNWRVVVIVAVVCTLLGSRNAAAQASDDWRVVVYPVFGWVPLGIGIDVDVPPGDGISVGGSGDIIDGRFDGAFLGGASVSKGIWRFDGDVLWAAVGGDRVDSPVLSVDADLLYGHGMVGIKFAPDWYVSGGVRRLAVKYDIRLGNQPEFERKPGVWDPLVGIGWHRERKSVDLHAIFEGGGFGAGSDVDLGATMRLDWRPIPHFGITAGYNFLYFKVSDTVRARTFTVKQSLHGPLAGIGLYF